MSKKYNLKQKYNIIYMFKISLILFIIGIIFISIGYANDLNPNKNINREIEFVPRSVYDEIVMSTSIN